MVNEQGINRREVLKGLVTAPVGFLVNPVRVDGGSLGLVNPVGLPIEQINKEPIDIDFAEKEARMGRIRFNERIEGVIQRDVKPLTEIVMDFRYHPLSHDLPTLYPQDVDFFGNEVVVSRDANTDQYFLDMPTPGMRAQRVMQPGQIYTLQMRKVWVGNFPGHHEVESRGNNWGMVITLFGGYEDMQPRTVPGVNFIYENRLGPAVLYKGSYRKKDVDIQPTWDDYRNQAGTVALAHARGLIYSGGMEHVRTILMNVRQVDQNTLGYYVHFDNTFSRH